MCKSLIYIEYLHKFHVEHIELILDRDERVDALLGVHDARMVTAKHPPHGIDCEVRIFRHEPHEHVPRNDELFEPRLAENVLDFDLSGGAKSHHELGQFFAPHLHTNVQGPQGRVGRVEKAVPACTCSLLPELFDGYVEVHFVATSWALHRHWVLRIE